MERNENTIVYLFVSGGDYSALIFEEHFNPQTVYEGMLEKGQQERVIQSDDYYIEVEIKEFAGSEDEFMDFLNSEIPDDDESKNSNLYEVRPTLNKTTA